MIPCNVLLWSRTCITRTHGPAPRAAASGRRLGLPPRAAASGCRLGLPPQAAASGCRPRPRACEQPRPRPRAGERRPRPCPGESLANSVVERITALHKSRLEYGYKARVIEHSPVGTSVHRDAKRHDLSRGSPAARPGEREWSAAPTRAPAGRAAAPRSTAVRPAARAARCANRLGRHSDRSPPRRRLQAVGRNVRARTRA